MVRSTPGQGREMSFSFRPTAQVAKAAKEDNVFSGRSLLRADEKKKEKGQKPKVNAALASYLSKNYGGDDGEDGADGGAKKRKKKKAKGVDVSETIKIVDQDLSGFVTAAAAPGKARGPTSFPGDDDDDDDDEDCEC